MTPINLAVSNEGFRLPLSREEFAAALRTGHGRVFLHAQQCGLAGMDDLLLEAVLRDQGYQDGQPRVGWVWELLKHSPSRNEILQAARGRFGSSSGGYHIDNLFGISMRAALEGDAEYAALMRDYFAREDELEPFEGVDEMLQAFGVQGAVLVLECWHRRKLHRPSFNVEPWCVARLFARIDRADLMAALRLRIPVSPFLAEYAEMLEKGMWQQEPTSKPKRAPRRLEDFFGWIGETLAQGEEASFGGAWLFGRDGDDNDALIVFGRLLQERDPRVLHCLLRYFSARPLPRYDRRIGDLALGGDEDLAHAAIQALALISAPDVRGLISEIAGRPPWMASPEYVPLFRSNFRPGDGRLIASMIPDDCDGWEEHDVLFEVMRVLESNPVQELVPLAVWTYGAMPCEYCRSGVVKWLSESGFAPAWLLDEALWDSSSITRNAVSRLAGVPPSIPADVG